MISIIELLYFVILTFVLGYIFSDLITDEPFKKRFSWEGLKCGMIVAAPAVILHELGHKFVAIGFGHTATFGIFWMGIGIALLLKFLNSPLLILAPAFVAIPSGVPNLDGMFIAFAGPAVNLALFGVSALVLHYKKKMGRKEFVLWVVSKRLNLFLFIFNMIPLPPLDGFHVLENLISIL